MAGRIYLLNGQSELLAMNEAPYDSENLLQELLAKYPDLLAGDQIDANDARRWLLVTREMKVPGESDGAGRWSVDHLFLDQDGVPTLVEVKRSSDTRVRREVVGQMLDYAANAVAYWPVEEIRGRYESRCQIDGVDPDLALANLLGEDRDPAQFWQQVKTNLQAGRLRVVFVADEIPTELRRIVEFLNGHMDPTEVLAVEVKQFVGGPMTTLVPRVLGQTEAAKQKRESASGRRQPISEESFLVELDATCSSDEATVARALIAWARANGFTDVFRRGQGDGAYQPVLRRNGMNYFPISVLARGQLSFRLRILKDCPPFDVDSVRDELVKRLTELPGFVATPNARDGYPWIPLSALVEKSKMANALQILDWIVLKVGREDGAVP